MLKMKDRCVVWPEQRVRRLPATGVRGVINVESVIKISTLRCLLLELSSPNHMEPYELRNL